MKKYDLDNDYVTVATFKPVFDLSTQAGDKTVSATAEIADVGQERMTLADAVQGYFFIIGDHIEQVRLLDRLLKNGYCYIVTGSGLYFFVLEK